MSQGIQSVSVGTAPSSGALSSPGTLRTVRGGRQSVNTPEKPFRSFVPCPWETRRRVQGQLRESCGWERTPKLYPVSDEMSGRLGSFTGASEGETTCGWTRATEPGPRPCLSRARVPEVWTPTVFEEGLGGVPNLSSSSLLGRSVGQPQRVRESNRFQSRKSTGDEGCCRNGVDGRGS